MSGSVGAVWAGGQGPLRILPPLLFRNSSPALQLLVAWLLTLAGSAILGVALAWLVPEGAGPDLGNASPAMQFVLITIFSPVLETLVMGGALVALLRLLRPWQAAVASAIGWGILHSLLAPMWGLVIWWPFLIFSIIFITWRAHGFGRAVVMAAAVHVAQNAVPAMGLLFGY